MENNILKNRKFLFFLAFFILLGAFHQLKFSRIHISEVPELLTTMRAKEFCSCYFMLGKGKEYCLQFVKKGYPLFNYTINESTKKVTFENPLGKASAAVLEGRYGCSIQ